LFTKEPQNYRILSVVLVFTGKVYSERPTAQFFLADLRLSGSAALPSALRELVAIKYFQVEIPALRFRCTSLRPE